MFIGNSVTSFDFKQFPGTCREGLIFSLVQKSNFHSPSRELTLSQTGAVILHKVEGLCQSRIWSVSRRNCKPSPISISISIISKETLCSLVRNVSSKSISCSITEPSTVRSRKTRTWHSCNGLRREQDSLLPSCATVTTPSKETMPVEGRRSMTVDFAVGVQTHSMLSDSTVPTRSTMISTVETSMDSRETEVAVTV